MIEWLRRLFRRPASEEARPLDPAPGGGMPGFTEPMAMGREGIPGEGGPSFFKAEIAELRWAAQHEAVNVARKDLDPTRWPDGEMSFEFERALAHAHEGLRDRLHNHAGATLRDQVRKLYEIAAALGSTRDRLSQIEERLVAVTRMHRRVNDEVQADALELARFARLRSPSAQRLKTLIMRILILSEFAISTGIFDRVIPSPIPFLFAGMFALGLMVLLMAIPHFVAKGLKEGLINRHKYTLEATEQLKLRPSPRLNRFVHAEQQDDNGFKIASYALGGLLVFLLLPLSLLRAFVVENKELAPTWLWFLFFLCIQAGISGYFFLREWLDHGEPSAVLETLTEQRDDWAGQRMAALAEAGQIVAAFHDAAEDVVFTIREAPRWDDYIVSSYYETIHYFRHLIAVERPEYDPFITWAHVPSLEAVGSVPEEFQYHTLVPTSAEHPSLSANHPVGRYWWLREMSDALKLMPTGADAHADDDVSWLMTKSPARLLSEFLKRYFDQDIVYTRHPELDIEDFEPWDDFDAFGGERLTRSGEEAKRYNATVAAIEGSNGAVDSAADGSRGDSGESAASPSPPEPDTPGS